MSHAQLMINKMAKQMGANLDQASIERVQSLLDVDGAEQNPRAAIEDAILKVAMGK